MSDSYSPVALPIDEIAAAWSRIAAATPRRARRLSMLRIATVALFAALAVPGGIVLWSVMSWILRTHSLLAAAPLLTHVVAILLAVGLPSNFGAPRERDTSFIRHRLTRFASRADRLRALRNVLVLESAVLGALPLVGVLITHDLPRWGVSAVIAVASTTILWPIERIARAQRNEAQRLAAFAE